ncbi:4-coumarate--CoA ligase 1 [Sergentomyia squamirostris]
MFSTTFDSEKKIWFGKRIAPFHHKSVSLGRVIYYTLSMNREKVAQISDNNGLCVTNGELLNQMLTIASNLLDRGVKRDSVIAIMARNGHLIASTIFSAFFLAIPVNTLDPNYSVDETAHMFSQTKPSIVFCDYENYETVQNSVTKIGSNIKVINFGKRIENVDNIEDYLVKTGREQSLEIVEVDVKTCALILCSSGTTGFSKGVSVSHQHLLYAFGQPTFLQNWENGTMFCFSSLYWYTGISHLLVTTFLGLTRIITTEMYSPDLCMSIIQKYKVTHIISSLMPVVKILEHKSLTLDTLSSLREYILGGSVIPKEIWSKLQTFLKNGVVQIAYGLTEIGVASRQNHDMLTHSVGKLGPGFQAKIVNDNNMSLTVGEVGEVCFKSLFRFLGYYGNDKATEEIIDEDGWIHSGDIGRIDKDGCLHVIDRKKDILKYYGHHISPSEIEAIIINHPDVNFVAVVGIPDPVYTDLPAAVVVCKEGATVSEGEISNLVASKLSETKHLCGGVYFVDQLPLTPSGKIIKSKVKETAIELYESRKQCAKNLL